MAGMATCLSYGGSRECRWFARADRVSESTKFSPANADREREGTGTRRRVLVRSEFARAVTV